MTMSVKTSELVSGVRPSNPCTTGEPSCAPSNLRRCSRCKVDKPATPEHFYRRSRREGSSYWKSPCKSCYREQQTTRDWKRECRASSQERAERGRRAQGGGEMLQPAVKPCSADPMSWCPYCAGQPWRVPGIRCRCGLRYAPEPRSSTMCTIGSTLAQCLDEEGGW